MGNAKYRVWNKKLIIQKIPFKQIKNYLFCLRCLKCMIIFFLKIDEEILVIMFVSHWCLICSCTHAFHQNTSRCQNIFLVVILIKINSFYYVLLNFCNINYEKKKLGMQKMLTIVFVMV